MNLRIQYNKHYNDGKAEGIITTARDFGASDDDIVSRLVSKLHVPAAEAQQMLSAFHG